MELNLLEKNELKIENITLEDTNLNRIAEIVAETFDLNRDEVLVVDVRDDHIALDILKKTIDAHNIFGKKEQLIDKLAAIDGVSVTEDTDITSQGILGNIALDQETTEEVLTTSKEMAAEIMANIAKRVKVFPTGFEVARGMIEDTNSPLIKNELSKEGYKVNIGEILNDDADHIAANIRRSINEGYGLIITTGGVGAEGKDRTVEGILKVISKAATPYIVHFNKGEGRHEKDGVRIAVGKLGQSLVVALPGPNDEVKLALDVLKQELTKPQVQQEVVAQNLAKVLRNRWREKMKNH